MTITSVRAQVLDGLQQVTINGRSAQDILPGFLALSDNDRRLAFELFYGCLHHYYELQAILKNRLQKPLKKGDADLGVLLILGLYQLTYTRIAEHAALNETVELCHHLKKTWATKLVNAILRRYQRDRKAQVQEQMSAADKVNLPNWLHAYIAEDWPEQAVSIYKASHERAPTTIRINQQQVSIEDYLEALKNHGIEFSLQAHHPQAISFDRVGDITQLPGYKEGWFSVQDGAAQFAALLIDAQPGDVVLDACAAPGGKASHIIEVADSSVTVVALDNIESRLLRLKENLTRLKLNADIRLGDALDTAQWYTDSDSGFDKILLDAPCSATGIIRRHPDIAMHRQPKDIRVLRQLQWRLLKTMWQLLKPGGTLIYSTCSILKTENEHLINDFLKQNEAAKLMPFSVGNSDRTKPGIWQILPGQDNMDGFFYAKLQKQG